MTQIPSNDAQTSHNAAQTIPTRNQLTRLYHWQHLATKATRSTKSEKRVRELLTAAYGESIGYHLAYKLIKSEGGDVTGWLLTLDTENAATFWISPALDVL